MASLLQIAADNGFTIEDVQYQLARWNENRGPLVITVTTIFTAFALVAVILRLITRKAIIKVSFQVDDYAILMATVGIHQETDSKVVDALIDFCPGALH